MPRAPRQVVVSRFEVAPLRDGAWTFGVECSAGTYVRSPLVPTTLSALRDHIRVTLADWAVLLRAIGHFEHSGYHTSHAYNPARRRLSEALAAMYAATDPVPLWDRYIDEKAKPGRGGRELHPADYPRHNSPIVENRSRKRSRHRWASHGSSSPRS